MRAEVRVAVMRAVDVDVASWGEVEVWIESCARPAVHVSTHAYHKAHSDGYRTENYIEVTRSSCRPSTVYPLLYFDACEDGITLASPRRSDEATATPGSRGRFPARTALDRAPWPQDEPPLLLGVRDPADADGGWLPLEVPGSWIRAFECVPELSVVQRCLGCL